MTGTNHIRRESRRRRGHVSPAAIALASAMAWLVTPAARADITNDATATAQYGATAVTSPPGSAAIPVIPAAPKMDIVKTGVLSDSDGIPGQSAGDRIDYTVTVKNSGNVSISKLTLADPMLTLAYQSGDAGQAGVLEVGETWTYTGSYILTQADLDSNGGGDGDIDNTVTASGTAGTTPVTATGSTATPIAATAHLSVKKTASVTSGVKPGDVITYTYVVTNDGNQTITGITLSDAHDGSGAPPVPGSEQLSSDLNTTGDSTDATPSDGTWSVLAPGDSVTFTATYTVTQTDLDQRQ